MSYNYRNYWCCTMQLSCWLRVLTKSQMANRKSQCIWLFSAVFDNKNQYLAFKRLRAAKLAVSTLDSQSSGPGFESRTGHLLDLLSAVLLRVQILGLARM